MKYMMRLSLRIMLVLAVTVSFQSTYADDETAAQGAKIYNENCARCHNPRGAYEFTEQEWSVIMPHMRHTGHLTGSESRSVEMFLAVTLTAEKANTKLEDLNDLSAQDLISKFACNGCHQIGGQGGNIGPSLDGIKDRRADDFIVQKLLEPTFNNKATAMPKFPLVKADASKIATYLTR